MLILTRKEDESIIIDDEIEIKVLAVEGNRVQLGIEAPKEITIHRQEVYQEIQRENKLSVSSKKNLSTDLTKMLKEGAKKVKEEDKRS